VKLFFNHSLVAKSLTPLSYFMFLSAINHSQFNKNIALSAVIKVFNILFVILIVRRSIEVLGVQEFGIWTAITSIATWLSLLDIGIGNGLRVELRRCFINENWREARTLLNTAYLFIAGLSAIVLLFFFIIWLKADWAAIFNIKDYPVQNVNLLVLVTVSGLIMQLVFSLLQPVLNANLHSGLENLFSTVANGLILCYLYTINEHNIDFLQYGLISAFLPALVYLGISIIYYKKYVPQIMPDFKEKNFGKIKPILLVSGKFFIIQISTVLMYQLTSFLLIRYFSPTEVAEYNVSFRYFNLFNIVFMTLLSPLWSMSTDAYLRGDIEWIIKTVKRYVQILVLILLALVAGYFMRDFVFKIWLNNMTVSPIIAMYVAIYTGIYCWNQVFLLMITGTGKINLQFILAIVTMILYLPLTHLLVRVADWGIHGLFISNIFILLIFSVLVPLQAYYVLKTDKKSYWLS
jgi:O-antigen/teichoic acid export membrane protein